MNTRTIILLKKRQSSWYRRTVYVLGLFSDLWQYSDIIPQFAWPVPQICMITNIVINAWKVSKYRRFFCSVFFCVWTEYRDLQAKSLYSVQIQESTDHKKLHICTLFKQCMSHIYDDILHLLSDLNQQWFSLESISSFANEIHQKEVPLQRFYWWHCSSCWKTTAKTRNNSFYNGCKRFNQLSFSQLWHKMEYLQCLIDHMREKNTRVECWQILD